MKTSELRRQIEARSGARRPTISSSSAQPARSARARSIRCRRLPRSAVSTICGSTSMARMARLRPLIPGAPDGSSRAGAGRLGRGRSAQVAVRAARGRLRARAAARGSAQRVLVSSAVLPASSEEALNFVDYGPQNSRGFRALKVWLALQQLGRAGYVESISEDMRLSRKLFDLLQEHPEFEALTQNLSITTFRYVPPSSGRSWATLRSEAVAQQTQRASAGARREERPGVLVERGHRRPVRAACVHRELPHVGRRHRGGARSGGGARTGIDVLKRRMFEQESQEFRSNSGPSRPTAPGPGRLSLLPRR